MSSEANGSLGVGWRRYLKLPGNVLALSFVSLLNDTSSEIIYPLLPAFLFLTLGASPFARRGDQRKLGTALAGSA